MVTSSRWRSWFFALAVSALWCGVPATAHAQLGALVSPGPLSKAHADLEGLSKCQSCHERGRQVSAPRCLTCHKPVAERIARKVGVHRNVQNDCVTCHVEHAGADAELRPFDARTFKHDTETAFKLSGQHADVAAQCTACHKGRSFLEARSACASCHTDVHKGSLGQSCERCHSVAAEFKAARTTFDHDGTRFALTGAHRSTTCASCHQGGSYKVTSFGTCSTCHRSPHAPASVQGTCASCHTTASWRTTKFDHSRTVFPLRGLHMSAACSSCHTRPATEVKPPLKTCAACHADPHRPAFKEDCAACHTEVGWQKGSFNHGTTRFPLVDKHTALTCVLCHKSSTPQAAAAGRATASAPRGAVSARGRPTTTTTTGATIRTTDFQGLRSTCVSCHADVHSGELGASCETCHSARTFGVGTFAHARPRPFFNGQHAQLTCAQCHQAAAPARGAAPVGVAAAAPRMARVGLTRTVDACASCHRDPHAGQFSATCDTCHAVDVPKFAVPTFAHERTRFSLVGKHTTVTCTACHKVETRVFAAAATATRAFTGMGTACASCHRDPHDGQLARSCERCHTSETFSVTRYTHARARALGSFFVGRHASAACSACHKTRPATAGQPVVADYRTNTSCISCHTDVHRGALGSRCETCHRP
jgi:hypothetical protein